MATTFYYNDDIASIHFGVGVDKITFAQYNRATKTVTLEARPSPTSLTIEQQDQIIQDALRLNVIVVRQFRPPMPPAFGPHNLEEILTSSSYHMELLWPNGVKFEVAWSGSLITHEPRLEGTFSWGDWVHTTEHFRRMLNHIRFGVV